LTRRPDDERRLARVDADMDEMCSSVDEAIGVVRQFTEDVDSDRLSVDGVVLEEMTDEDSLVISVEDGLRTSLRAQPGARP
jgi:hypothetical protein